ncbi:MAG: hypothetical protein ACRDH2_01640 [Anaerolineales bacterium]
MLFDQAEFQLRCEWGAPGVAQLAPTSDVIIIFEAAKSNLLSLLRQCGSGKELIERNCEPDIVLASQRDISTGVPVFVNGAYRQ